MEPPPIQYVRTSDGFDIPFTLAGSGPPLVMLPTPFGHLNNDWRWWKGPLLKGLTDRFRLLHYNSRGHGMATRGLDESFEVQDYVQDLQAVVDEAGFDRFAIFGHPLFNYVAVLYALAHPERVSMVLLQGVGAGRAWQEAESWESIARESWERFLHAFAAWANVIPNRESWQKESMRLGLSQDDFLKVIRASKNSRPLAEVGPGLEVPVLIVAGTEPPGADEGARRLAGMIRGSRLVVFEGYARYLQPQDEQAPPIVDLLDTFLRDAGLREDQAEPAAGPPQAGLSPREIEVLRLVAAGKTNREIADALVISEHTVIRHLSNIFTKTGAENRAGAAAFGLRHRLV
jgi:DNA-binding CsgD family transcriptional regulator/pimeloyl-ACP methyl ester carboxylesterase